MSVAGYKEVSTDWMGAVRSGKVRFLAGQAVTSVAFLGLLTAIAVIPRSWHRLWLP